MAVDPPAPVTITSWADTHLWPGWERDAFLAACSRQGYIETETPWELFARWWRKEGMWSESPAGPPALSNSRLPRR